MDNGLLCSDESCEYRREAKELLPVLGNLLDDLVFCARNCDSDPCQPGRRSQRTRKETLKDAVELRDLFWEIGRSK